MVLACTALASEVMAAKKVAVYAEGDISKDTKSIICSSVLARMSGDKNFEAYERNSSFINALNKEQDYQTSGEVPESEIRTVAQRMGSDYVIVVTTIISDDDHCFMSARMIDLVTGKIVKTVDLDREYTGTESIKAMSNNIAYRLLDSKSK